jgi:membrane associated rhomboid family serine protease
MARPKRFTDHFDFGGRMPGTVGFLIALTLVVSIVAAFTSRHGVAIASLLSLEPERVWHGQVWRLASWVFMEGSPIGLLFACLILYWFGRDLSAAFGASRFLSIYLGLTLFAGAGTCLLGLVDGDIMGHYYAGMWALSEAMMVGWGLLYPTRQIYIYFILPVTGRILAYFTLALTVLYAIYAGWEGFVPNLLAEGGMLALIYRRQLIARIESFRTPRVRRPSHLRVVDRNDSGRGYGPN